MTETIFGRNIMTALERKGMTPDACAARCRIPAHEFDLYAKGICFPDSQTLGRIADALDVRVKDLAGDAPLTYTSFGQELRAMREAVGLKRTEFAELTSIPYKSLANYEGDKVNHVEQKNIEKLREALGDEIMTAIKKYNMNPVKKTPKAKIEAPKAKVTAPKPVAAPEKGIEKSWFDLLKFIESDREFRKAVNVLVYGKETPDAEKFPEASLVIRMIREG